MARLRQIGKTLAKVLVPGSLVIPHLLRNRDLSTSSQVDGVQGMEEFSRAVDSGLVYGAETLRLGAYYLLISNLL